MREAINEASLYTHTTMNNIFHHRLLWLKWKAAKGTLRDGALENLWRGGGGGGRSTKKIFAEGKIKWRKNSCTLNNPKKYSCYGLKKKFHSRNLMTKKNSCGLKIPHPPSPPPITFLMVRPYREISIIGKNCVWKKVCNKGKSRNTSTKVTWDRYLHAIVVGTKRRWIIPH